MNKQTEKKYKLEIETFKFLERDFNQCFQQLRHYDIQSLEILKFLFISYTVLISATIGLYQLGFKNSKNLTFFVIAVLVIGLIIGIFMFSIILRNRIYYVRVARYINEHRGFFFKFLPDGFENKSEMYTNYTEPKYYNWCSSHLWLSYIIATMNSVLFSLLLFISMGFDKIITSSGLSVVFLSIQLNIAIRYLRRYEYSKSIFR